MPTHRHRCGIPSTVRSGRPRLLQLGAGRGQRSLQVALLLRRRQGARELLLRSRQVRHQPRLPSIIGVQASMTVNKRQHIRVFWNIVAVG